MKTRIRLKLARAEGRKNIRGRFDVSKLQSKEIRRRYNIEERNRFEDLGDIEDPQEEHDYFGNIQRCSKESFEEVKET